MRQAEFSMFRNYLSWLEDVLVPSSLFHRIVSDVTNCTIKTQTKKNHKQSHLFQWRSRMLNQRVEITLSASVLLCYVFESRNSC